VQDILYKPDDLPVTQLTVSNHQGTCWYLFNVHLFVVKRSKLIAI